MKINWYDGSLAVAFELSRTAQGMCLVYIHNGKVTVTASDDQFEKTLEEVNMDQFGVNFIGIKLTSESEDAKHFATLISIPALPALFALGTSGIPLKVFTAVGGIDKDGFVEDFRKTVEYFRKTLHCDTMNKEEERCKQDEEFLPDREKLTDDVHFKRVLEHIRRGRENRVERDRIGVDRVPVPAPAMIPIPTGQCRIQVYFTNGSSLILRFPINRPLRTIICAITDGCPHAHFHLIHTHPLRELNDLEMSLFQHGLTPFAQILALPAKPVASV